MSRQQIAHLPCGCRLVLEKGVPRRWSHCATFHSAANMHALWTTHAALATLHDAEARETCPDRRCHDAVKTLAETKSPQTTMF